MDVYLDTLGCRLNEAELAAWTRALRAAGHQVVARPELAQVVVVNSCAVTSEAARKSRQLVSRAHRANPHARLVVTGCYAELSPDRVAALAGVDAVIGNIDKDALAERLTRDFAGEALPAPVAAPPDERIDRRDRTRAFVKVQDGCRNHCTFCVVTIARGEERSRSIASVVSEVRQLVDQGYREVVLTGVHLGGYGHDLADGTDLAALARALLADTDVERLRLSSLEPWDLPPDFFAVWEHPRLMPHLHLPLQSGCDETLRRMARRCSAAEFAALAASARDAIPDLTLTTDLIVGFPGETDGEWAQTMDLVRRVGFGHIHIFSYSPREGTRAARMPGHVPTPVKKARSRQMHELAAELKSAHLTRFLGQERPVLWEGDAGYTDNYLRVSTWPPAELDNVIAPATLARIADSGDGYVAPPPRIDASANRPHRLRLPVYR